MTASKRDRRQKQAWWSVLRLLRSFRPALAGARWLVVHEPNAAIHLLATVVVVTVGVFLGLSTMEWGLLAVAVGLVWMAEAFNSAIEQAPDAMHPEPHPGIGRAKDLAAAAVLIAAVTAIAIAIALLAPRIIPQLASRAADATHGSGPALVDRP